MATNPPITIRIFTNVPAPGSGVKSDWAQSISQYVAPTAWTGVTFLNSWVNAGAGQPMQYRKEGDVVRVRGNAQSGTIGQPMCTLPAGFRAPGSLWFPTVSNGVFGTIYVETDGSIYAWSGSNASFKVNISYSTVA